jgi:hypothetical protein
MEATTTTTAATTTPATLRFCKIRYYVRGMLKVEGGHTAQTAAARAKVLCQRPLIRDVTVADYCEAR